MQLLILKGRNNCRQYIFWFTLDVIHASHYNHDYDYDCEYYYDYGLKDLFNLHK